VLRALVIVPNKKTRDLGSLLAIARSEAAKREHSNRKPPIRALNFVPELGVYVVVYETLDVQKPGVGNEVFINKNE